MAFGTERGRQAFSLSIVFTTLATVFTIIRIYARAFLVKQMGADDWVILISLAFSWAFFGLFAGEVKFLMGEHIALIPKEVLTKQMICFWASVPIYQTSLIATKASILLQYRRVFSTPRMRLACNCLIGFLGIYGTWTIVSAWVNCVPVQKFWDDSVEGYCLNEKALWFSNSGIHIFTDILILIYPMPVLKNLQIPTRQKTALMGVFALGAFVLVTSCLRLKSLLIISNSTDPTYDNPPAAMWSAIECNVAIICACMPGCRAFISKLVPRFFSTRSGTYGAYGAYGYGRSKSNNKNPATRSQHTAHSNFQASVTGPPAFHMASISRRADSSDSKESISGPLEEIRGKIKVTTVVSQETVSHVAEDASSVRHLI